jgi:hypothetical protein
MTALDALYLRYDGPIPLYVLETYQAGGADKARRAHIQSTVREYEGMARRAQRGIVRLRQEGQQGTAAMVRAREHFLWLHDRLRALNGDLEAA